ncbi:hypothetical protein CALCODRAFT_501871 [Calocera cornea HHB12733]|uniref:Uncharacterized protein n=1 Tax=Calocera cornea HHB12733 TaxID=1353952 RepID=A0A165DHH3_9BASI|nr:hypothetical protein CALCODRAFT_501871 [Calocera cornea HHB12733]
MSTSASPAQLSPASSGQAAPASAAPHQLHPSSARTLFQKLKQWATSGPYRQPKQYKQEFPGSEGEEDDVPPQSFPGNAD